MTTKLWEVTFDAKYTQCKDWMDEEVTVLAPTGEKAVEKARRHTIGRTFKDERDSGSVLCRCSSVRLTGLRLVRKVDAA